MKKLLLCGLVSSIALFACVGGKEDEPDPGDEELGEVESALTCCIDFTCPGPEPYDFTTTGCRTGAGPTIAGARDECEAGCPVMCASSGLYCQ
jgi:hypothetical protein